MSSKQSSQPQSPFSTLRRFVREKAPDEQCDMCSVPLAPEHQHLFESSSRKLICSCDACAILFSNQGSSKYRRVPRRARFLQGFRITDAEWESLMIPINMAFFFNSTPAEKVIVLYPSPAGATESLLSLESWEEITQNNPVLKEMEPDVEAFLVNRVGSAQEYYIAPIDECFKLVGIIRLNWKGLGGGSEVWEEIKRFFAELKERSVWVAPDESVGNGSPLSGGESDA